jgi:hypothetical protein
MQSLRQFLLGMVLDDRFYYLLPGFDPILALCHRYRSVGFVEISLPGPDQSWALAVEATARLDHVAHS